MPARIKAERIVPLEQKNSRAICSVLTVVGVGASIDATILLALAGGQLWMGTGQCLPIRPSKHLVQLVLFTPPTGFFQAPGALDSIQTPIQVWAGTNDTITPLVQTEFLERRLESRVPVELRVVDGAGHFSFMNTLPPQITDPLVNREAFLGELAADVCRFILDH